MARPFRIRRILKWTGLALSVLIIVGWFDSYGGQFWWMRTWQSQVFIDDGAIFGIWADPYFDEISSSDFALAQRLYSPFRPEFTYRKATSHGFASILVLPLWLLLLLTAIPTAWLWHRDRGWKRPGCCLRCGYELTGNTSGVCPECGDKVHPPAVLADSGCGEKKAMANSEERIAN